MDSRSPVTLADIAESAHVSVGTVSRVLNGRKGSIKISHIPLINKEWFLCHAFRDIPWEERRKLCEKQSKKPWHWCSQLAERYRIPPYLIADFLQRRDHLHAIMCASLLFSSHPCFKNALTAAIIST
jgi:transcriptional regulator with XRE-family HTH domain